MGIHRDWSAYTRIGPWLFNFAHIDARYQKGPADQCWTWTGGLHRQGYGMCGGIEDQGNDTYRRFMTVVHRPLMMRHLNRALTHDDFVIKTCANNLCCNTAHYILGDYKKKTQIMKSNGRVVNNGKTKRAGVEYKQNRNYKYTEEEIVWMRDADTKEIAAHYNISRSLAGFKRWEVRGRYRWLPWPNDPKLRGTDNE